MTQSPATRMSLAFAAFSALVAVGLLANRWHASRALEAARARSEALGLRLDRALLAGVTAPEVQAALVAAHEACEAVDARALARHDAAAVAVEQSVERLAALTRAEAHLDAEALEAAAAGFLAAGPTERPGDKLRPGAFLATGGASTELIDPALVRVRLVEQLSGAAREAFAAGEHTEGWRQLELAARLCATQHGSELTAVGFIALMLGELSAALDEAASLAPDDAGLERVRAVLRDIDVRHEARTAMRNDASVLLSTVEQQAALGAVHTASVRLLSHDVRDLALLHELWSGLVEASEQVSDADQKTAMAAVRSRLEELPQTYALTRLTVARALGAWEWLPTIEATHGGLLGDPPLPSASSAQDE